MSLRAANPYTERGLKVKIVEKPLNLLVTLAEMKNFLRVNHDKDDVYIITLIKAVQEAITGKINKSLTERAWQASFDYAPRWGSLPYGPVISITQIQRMDTEGVKTVIDPADYYLEDDAVPTRFVFKSYQDGRIIVTYRAGYDPNEIPAQIPAAVYQEVALQYKNRNDADMGPSVVSRGLSVEALVLLSPLIEVTL